MDLRRTRWHVDQASSVIRGSTDKIRQVTMVVNRAGKRRGAANTLAVVEYIVARTSAPPAHSVFFPSAGLLAKMLSPKADFVFVDGHGISS